MMKKTKALVEVTLRTSRASNDYYNLPAPFVNMEDYLKDHIIVINGEEIGHKLVLNIMVPSGSRGGQAFIWAQDVPNYIKL